MSVSICIPTYRRPAMLRQCIQSCFANDLRPLEIVVSDDAAELHVQEMVEAIDTPTGVSIVYTWNHLGKGQAKNVNCAFQTASQSRLVLMHDDDFFLPGGLDLLDAAWVSADDEIDACYGFQAICHSDGLIDEKSTSGNNYAYFRRSETIGRQDSALWAALVGQFPNNGYMIRRSIAVETGYPTEEEVGSHPVDHHFGIRYAQASTHSFLLIRETVTAYRRSEASIARFRASRFRPHQQDAQLGWMALSAITPNSALEQQGLDLAMDRVAQSAIESTLFSGEMRQATWIARHKSTAWPRSYLSFLKAVIFLVTGASDRFLDRFGR